ncbi:MAG TPA: RnfABCDGE type electron transport complex subunit D [Chloroflexota bacterium]|nr:RnfABCDGE type electron transport complex subunit D [Chloroflexota bacterium]
MRASTPAQAIAVRRPGTPPLTPSDRRGLEDRGVSAARIAALAPFKSRNLGGSGQRCGPLQQRLRQFARTPKGWLLAFFLVLLGLGSGIGWSVVLPHVVAAVLGASLTELAVDRFGGRPLTWPSSALLSGLIVGFVLDPFTALPVTAAVGVLATLSKYLFAGKRWHVFNPAGLALLLSVPLFGTGQSWWGALPDLSWPFVLVLLAGGTLIVDRINKAPLVLTFLGTTFGLFTALSVVDPSAVAELFRAPFLQATLFLALFMLTDPPTSPSRYEDQVAIGVLVGAVSCAAQLLGAGQSYLLLGLLVGNLALACRRLVLARQRTVVAPVGERAGVTAG